MGFIERISASASVSVVGLAKHAGKTECLNYILRELNRRCGRETATAVTSIGVDGEGHDITSGVAKPEITIYEGMTFVTSEAHYRQRRLTAEILSVEGRRTALGRLVTARAVTPGKVVLSGPADTESLGRLIAGLKAAGIRTTIVDGALSRMSPASPAVTEGIVLATGASVSPDMAKVVEATAYVCELIALPRADESLARKFAGIGGGIWGLDDEGRVVDSGIGSGFTIGGADEGLAECGDTLFVSGAVNDALLRALTALCGRGGRGKDGSENGDGRNGDCGNGGESAGGSRNGGIRLIVRDFTRLIASPEAYRRFCAAGGRTEVLERANLLAVCANPVSPTGYSFDSAVFRAKLSERLAMPVWDVRMMQE